MPTQNLFGVPIVVLSKISSIEIDLVEQVTVQRESLITQNPTEIGRNISDHIVKLPTVISLAGRFVDSPLGPSSDFNPLEGFAIVANEGLIGGLSVQQWNKLEELREGSTLFDVVIQQGVYTDMAIRSLSAPRTKGDGTSQRFQIEMLQVVTTEISALTAAAPETSADVAPTAPAVVDAGPQSTPLWTGGI